MGKARVQLATRRIAEALRDLGVPYAIAGGIAVTVHGHERVTKDVDVLLTSEGLRTFKERWLGRGWVERFPGSRGMRDVETTSMSTFCSPVGIPATASPSRCASRIRLVSLWTLVARRSSSCRCSSS